MILFFVAFCFSQTFNVQQRTSLITVFNDLCNNTLAGCNLPDIASVKNCSEFETLGGVECDANGNVYRLDLNTRSLTGSITSALNSLSFLQSLQV